MKSVVSFSLSEIPEDGLRFFHGISNWVEQSKTLNPHLVSWKYGHKALNKLTCLKSKHGKNVEPPKILPYNTLYVPYFSSGLYVLRQIRHAFCHNDLIYDKTAQQYYIALTDRVKIVGRFSLEAIKEFVQVFLSETNNNQPI